MMGSNNADRNKSVELFVALIINIALLIFNTNHITESDFDLKSGELHPEVFKIYVRELCLFSWINLIVEALLILAIVVIFMMLIRIIRNK